MLGVAEHAASLADAYRTELSRPRVCILEQVVMDGLIVGDAEPACQSASNIAPRSASKIDPLVVDTDVSTRVAAAGRGCGGGARAGSLA